jgi:hypothetical protein
VRTHKVQQGETLRAIAFRYTRDANRASELVATNPITLRNPDVIRPGLVIVIPPNWPPLVVDAGAADTSPAAPNAILAAAQRVLHWLAPSFWPAIIETARASNIEDPEHLMRVLYAESELRPWAVNRAADGHPVAIGLIQITPVARAGVGLTPESWLALEHVPATEQMRGVVRRFFEGVAHFRQRRPYTSVADVYQAVFAPGTMSRVKLPTDVIYPAGDARALANKGVDLNADGSIQLGELAAFPDRRTVRGRAARNDDERRRQAEYDAAVTLLRHAQGSGAASSPGTPSSGGGVARGPTRAGAAVALALGVIGYLAFDSMEKS